MVRILVLVAMTAACLPKTYHCSSDSDCGATGACRSNGFCSFLDGTCATGYRYGDLSGGFSNQCVGAENDGPVDTSRMIDSPIDTMPDAARPFCDTADTSLVGCWEFENNANDASGNNNNGTPTSVTYAAGHTGMAAVLTASSHIAVADSTSLATATGHITIEGWINMTALPGAGLRMGVVDNDSRYGLFIYSTNVGCTVGVSVSAATLPTPGTWTHVACTFDGTTGIIYVNGSNAGMTGGGGTLGAGNGNGTALGGNSPSADTLVGMIDQFRIFNEPRTATEICHDAGMTTCP